MESIQVIKLLDVIQVRSAMAIPDSYPRQLRITGDDFRYAQTVILNGVETTAFTIESRHSIRVVVPGLLANERITTISVLSSRITMTESSLVTFDMGGKPHKVSGVMRLLQSFTRLLFRTPGSNIFYPNSGGNVRSIVAGRNTDVASVSADLSIAVDRVRDFILSAQSQDRTLPPSERLLSAKVTSVSRVDETTIEASVEIRNHLGAAAAATFVA